MLWFISMTSISLHLNVEYNMIPLDSVKKKKGFIPYVRRMNCLFQDSGSFQVSQQLDNMFGHGWWGGKMITSGLESVLISSSDIFGGLIDLSLGSALFDFSAVFAFKSVSPHNYNDSSVLCFILRHLERAVKDNLVLWTFYSYFLRDGTQLLIDMWVENDGWGLTKSCSFRPRSFCW